MSIHYPPGLFHIFSPKMYIVRNNTVFYSFPFRAGSPSFGGGIFLWKLKISLAAAQIIWYNAVAYVRLQRQHPRPRAKSSRLFQKGTTNYGRHAELSGNSAGK